MPALSGLAHQTAIIMPTPTVYVWQVSLKVWSPLHDTRNMMSGFTLQICSVWHCSLFVFCTRHLSTLTAVLFDQHASCYVYVIHVDWGWDILVKLTVSLTGGSFGVLDACDDATSGGSDFRNVFGHVYQQMCRPLRGLCFATCKSKECCVITVQCKVEKPTVGITILRFCVTRAGC